MNRNEFPRPLFFSRCWIALTISLALIAPVEGHAADEFTCYCRDCSDICTGCDNPCENCVDNNADGVIDFCELVLFTEDFGSFNSRSDFSCDGIVNLSDAVIIWYEMCNEPPIVPASPSSASIGVYFDAGGTITQLDDVPVFTYVDVYVVAHNFTEMGGYAFALEIDDSLSPGSLSWPDNSLLIDTQAINPSVRTYAVGGESFCLAADETTVLVQIRMLYFGGQNATVEIKPAESCVLPQEGPAFISCGGGCEWNYFELEGNGMAVINPEDFNENGQPDLFEHASIQFYEIQGTSDGTGWSMGIRSPNGSWDPHYSLENMLPSGATASDFLAAFVAWINTLSESVKAFPVPLGGSFMVSLPGYDPFELGVGAYGETPDCWVSTDSECAFNPLLAQIADPATGVPDRPIFGLSSYPNPFNPQTTIAFDLPAASQVDLRVYDPAGRLVRTLIAGRTTGAGHHEVVWDGRDDNGAAMAAGLYVYRLDAAGRSESGNMILVK